MDCVFSADLAVVETHSVTYPVGCMFANSVYCIQNSGILYLCELTQQLMTFGCFAEAWKCDDISAGCFIKHTHTGM